MELSIILKSLNVINKVYKANPNKEITIKTPINILDTKSKEIIGTITKQQFISTNLNTMITDSFTNIWNTNYFIMWGVCPISIKSQRNYNCLQKNISFYFILIDQSPIASITDQVIDYVKYIKWERGQTYLLVLGVNSLIDEFERDYDNLKNRKNIGNTFTNAFLYLDYCLYVNSASPDTICKTMCNVIFLFNKLAIKSLEIKLESEKYIKELKADVLNNVIIKTHEFNLENQIYFILNLKNKLEKMLKHDVVKLGSLLYLFENGLCLAYKTIKNCWDIKIYQIRNVNKYLMY